MKQNLRLQLRGPRLRPSAPCASTPEAELPSNNIRYRVKLSKPLGIVLSQGNGNNAIFVVEVTSFHHQQDTIPCQESLVEGGAADKTGIVQEGDQLISTSGVIYTSSRKYGDTNVKGGLQVVQMNVINEVQHSHPVIPHP